MIGPPVEVAKKMRDFEKDESLFDFDNTKSRQPKNAFSKSNDVQPSTNQESSNNERKNA